ncbi:MAG: MFS transporter [Anaerobacillus sp.]
MIAALLVLQCILGLMQPIYASLSFALLPDICKDEELIEANALLDGTLRLMSFLAPGLTALLLLAIPMHYIYTLSSVMFFLSFLSLSRLPTTKKKDAPLWTRRFWWEEMKEGYRTFFEHRELIKLTMLSSTVQFAVGATMVLSVPFL